MLVQQHDVYFQSVVTFETDKGLFQCRAETFRVIATPQGSEIPSHFFDAATWDQADKMFIATGTGTLPADIKRCMTPVLSGEGTVAHIEWDGKEWRCAGSWTLTATRTGSV